jgi:beta-lactamase class A
VVMGTILSIWNPVSCDRIVGSEASKGGQIGTQMAEKKLSTASETFDSAMSPKVGHEIAPLKAAIASVADRYPQLKPQIFIIELDTGAYVDLNASKSLASASTIKIPILVAFLQDVDNGKIRPDELLTMDATAIASGSGTMQNEPPGTKFTALETATKMMTISDNTATNMLIARLGGKEVLNQRFREWGLLSTMIRNKLPDLEGTNTTSPKELATLMARVNQGELVSLESRDRMLEIMRNTQRNHLLPRGLGEGAKIAHKTGNIGSMVADVGLIDLPSGKRYIAAVMVKRSRNNLEGETLIRQVSRQAYAYFSKPLGNSKTPTEDAQTSDNSNTSATESSQKAGNSSSGVAEGQLQD